MGRRIRSGYFFYEIRIAFYSDFDPNTPFHKFAPEMIGDLKIYENVHLQFYIPWTTTRVQTYNKQLSLA